MTTTAQYVGRCQRHGCGMALWVSGKFLFAISAGKPLYRCGRMKRHKPPVEVK